MPKHFIFDKLSDKKNRLKIALQVSKLGSSPIVMPGKRTQKSEFWPLTENNHTSEKKIRVRRWHQEQFFLKIWGKSNEKPMCYNQTKFVKNELYMNVSMETD